MPKRIDGPRPSLRAGIHGHPPRSSRYAYVPRGTASLSRTIAAGSTWNIDHQRPLNECVLFVGRHRSSIALVPDETPSSAADRPCSRTTESMNRRRYSSCRRHRHLRRQILTPRLTPDWHWRRRQRDAAESALLNRGAASKWSSTASDQTGHAQWAPRRRSCLTPRSTTSPTAPDLAGPTSDADA
jgi:hypothetical protein